MVSLLRCLSGYVEFCAEGGFPERFLNLCKIRGISLWRIENDGVKVKACTSSTEFDDIYIPAENSGMQIKILQKKGLPFLLKRHKWRFGAALGAVIAVGLVWFMSGFIWEVEIVEENGVKIENFTESLADLGVKPGARKSKIDILEVQEQLLNRYPELSWVSLNIFGDKAQIEYTPAKSAPSVIDENTPTNVIATKSGRITLIEGYSGTNMVKEGAYVAKDSLLISGVRKNADGSEEFVHARGKVFAQTENDEKYSVKRSFETSITGEDYERYVLELFSLKIPLGFKPQGEIYSETGMPLEGNSTVLPVGITRDDSVVLSEAKVEFTDDELLLLNLTECINRKRSAYNETEIQKIKYISGKEDDCGYVIMKITCIEDISTESPFLVEEN